MTNGKTPQNDERDTGTAAEAPYGQDQADGPAFESGPSEAPTAMDEARPVPRDEGVKWEPGD